MACLCSDALRLRARVGELGTGLLGGGLEDPACVLALRRLVVSELGEHGGAALLHLDGELLVGGGPAAVEFGVEAAELPVGFVAQVLQPFAALLELAAQLVLRGPP